MSQRYEPEFKKKIARLHIEGQTIKSLTAEYEVSKASVTKWTEEYREECQNQTYTAPDGETHNELEVMEENRRLQKDLAEAKKEILFLKKAAAFFAKEID